MTIRNHSEKNFEGQGPDPKKIELGGGIFINNTSYSGADIKIVINVYKQEEERQEKIKELNAASERDSKALLYHQGREARATDLLQTVKKETPEYTRISATRRDAQKNVETLQNSIVDTTGKIKELTKGKSKATSKVLAECQTISISSHREKMAVRGFGSVYPRGFVRSQREIAGSMIFTVFNEHVLYEFLDADASDFDGLNQYTTAILDQIPPVDITIAFANEYGQVSRMALYGVEFVDEGQVMSIEDIMTENTVSFVARDFDPMRAVSERIIDSNGIMITDTNPLKASDLLLEDDFKEFKRQVDPFGRFKQRRNPFL